MPTYEYECSHCHCRFDRKQGFNEDSESACPKCQGKATRVFHPVPILFKGSGFYVTDHGRGWAGSAGRDKESPADKETVKKEDKSAAPKEPPKKEGEGATPKEPSKKENQSAN